MEQISPQVFEGLKELDAATIFNAVIEARGASQGGKELEDKGGVRCTFTVRVPVEYWEPST